MARSQRDHRNWSKGYQEGLLDMVNAISEGGIEGAVEWVKNNGNADTRAHLDAMMLIGDADGEVHPE
jgi:hypothetical protein